MISIKAEDKIYVLHTDGVGRPIQNILSHNIGPKDIFLPERASSGSESQYYINEELYGELVNHLLVSGVIKRTLEYHYVVDRKGNTTTCSIFSIDRLMMEFLKDSRGFRIEVIESLLQNAIKAT